MTGRLLRAYVLGRACARALSNRLVERVARLVARVAGCVSRAARSTGHVVRVACSIGRVALTLCFFSQSCRARCTRGWPAILLGRDPENLVVTRRGGNRAGRAGLGRSNSGSGQNRVGPKLARFFRAKILTAQPALKTGPVGPNSLFKAIKNSGGPGHTGPGQIWPGFFLAKNLMTQPGPNFGRTGLAYRAGPILPPLVTRLSKDPKISFLHSFCET